MLRTSVSSVRRRMRHVLAPGVHHHLDVRVGEHARERGEVGVALERVEHLGAHAALGVRVGHRHLHQAQQRLVAALGHELRVDCNPPSRGCALGQLCDHERLTLARQAAILG